jgi:hypothetical protein
MHMEEQHRVCTWHCRLDDRRILLFGGDTGRACTRLADTWLLTASTSTPTDAACCSSTSTDSSTSAHASSSPPGHGVSNSSGGSGSGSASDRPCIDTVSSSQAAVAKEQQTWSWSHVSTSTSGGTLASPTPRSNHAVAVLGDHVVVFGGWDASGEHLPSLPFVAAFQQ